MTLTLRLNRRQLKNKTTRRLISALLEGGYTLRIAR